MDIHVDIRGFLEIQAWICYGFSDKGNKKRRLLSVSERLLYRYMRRHTKASNTLAARGSVKSSARSGDF